MTTLYFNSCICPCSGDEKPKEVFTLPDSFPFWRDPVETETQFKARLQVILRSPVLAGQAVLLQEEYNLRTQVLPLRIRWESWFSELQCEIGIAHLRLQQAALRAILEKGDSYWIYAHLKLVENGNLPQLLPEILLTIEKLTLQTSEYSLPIFHCLPPALLCTLQGHHNWTRAVAFHHTDSLLLASGSEDNTVRLWDVGSGQLITNLQEQGGINAIAFSPDGFLLASGSNDATIRLWEVGTGKERHILQGHLHTVFSVAFSPDGLLLASGGVDKTVKLWEVETGRELFSLQGHTSWVFSVAFSPDGRVLASGSRDKTIKLWDVSNGQQISTLGVTRPS